MVCGSWRTKISPHQVVSTLRKYGHQVIDVKEEGWPGESDGQLIAYAAKHQLIILTHDKDFLYQSLVSVILLRFLNQKPDNVSKYLLKFLANPVIKNLRAGVGWIIVTEAGAEINYP